MDYYKELRKRTNHMSLVLPHSIVVLFNDKGEVLLEERADDGFFDFPGGGIDLKESAEDAAKRELKEETNLIADELELFKVYSEKSLTTSTLTETRSMESTVSIYARSIMER